MASSRRTARTLLAGACLVPLMSVPGVASAAPPDHAQAGARTGHERSDSGAADRGAARGRPDHAADRGRRDRAADRDRGTASGRTRTTAQAGGERTTSSATASGTTASSSPSGGPADTRGTATTARDDRPGRGHGRTSPPGRAAKETGDRQLAGGAGTPATAPTPAQGGSPAGSPSVTPSVNASSPAGTPAAGPSIPAPPPTFAVAVPSAPAPDPVGDGPVAADVPEPAAAPTPGVLAFDDRVQGLLDDLTESVQRTVPEALGPIREPLADLVPMLLLILGAFLVAQRGIGRGLGHVPMAGPSPRRPSRS